MLKHAIKLEHRYLVICFKTHLLCSFKNRRKDFRAFVSNNLALFVALFKFVSFAMFLAVFLSAFSQTWQIRRVHSA